MRQLDIFECIEIATRGLDGKRTTNQEPGVRSLTCSRCKIDMREEAVLCGFCEQEERRVIVNEERADCGVRAVAEATKMPHPLMESPIVTAIEDTLTCIAHSCDRFQLDPTEMFRDALRAYKSQIANGARVPAVADGDHMTMTEVRNPCHNCVCDRMSAIS